MTKTNIPFDLRAWATGFLIALTPVGLASTPSFADDPNNSDWPCVYRKVPELSAAAIWDGPAITDTTSWRKDDQVRKLSEYLSRGASRSPMPRLRSKNSPIVFRRIRVMPS